MLYGSILALLAYYQNDKVGYKYTRDFIMKCFFFFPAVHPVEQECPTVLDRSSIFFDPPASRDRPVTIHAHARMNEASRCKIQSSDREV